MTKTEINKFYKTYRVPKNIIAHMQKVAEICEILADKFEKKGIEIDKELLISAALLHDAIRVCDMKEFKPLELDPKATEEDIAIWKELRLLYGKIGHEMAVSRLLRFMGEPNVAGLILKHDFYRIDNLNTWEEKILYYADKRVDHDKIVTLQTRFVEGRKRNNDKDDNFDKIDAIEQKIYLLEKELIAEIGEFSFDA
jgi:5'-deoxynucleotidase YfbR-like HD superfamily hydrolase